MKQLRHYVLYTHLRMEESLGNLIVRHTLSPLLPPDNDFNEQHQTVFAMGTASIVDVDYYRKVEQAHITGQIDDRTRTLMEQVNNLRKYFSHPSKYWDKLQELKQNRAKYKEVLKQLLDAHLTMNAIFVKFLPSKKG